MQRILIGSELYPWHLSNYNQAKTMSLTSKQKGVLKISFGSGAHDIVRGILPSLIDLYMGNLTHFNAINIQTAGNGR